MGIVNLDEIKSQLRIDHDDDDAILQKKADAAQAHVERLLGFKVETQWPDANTIPQPIRECVLQLASHWYENREAVLFGETAQETPISLTDVVNEYRNWSWAD